MIIPHQDPDPDPDPPVPLFVDYPKEEGLKWDDFHPPSKHEARKLHQRDESDETYWMDVANMIDDYRRRFIQHNPQIGNPRLCNLDRSAVLTVYNEALSILEHTSKDDASRIFYEARTKVEVILDVQVAKPRDPVFLAEGAYLTPLEPQYAQPRLNYYNRDDENGEDSYYWGGWARLYAWRKEGWPHVYPAKAVERERREREKRRREGRILLRATASEELLRAYHADPLDWGEEVDADPERPWR